MKNKRLIIVIYSFIGLLITSISIDFGFEYLVHLNKWLGLITGGLFMVFGIIVFQFGKKIPLVYALSFLLNMIGVGLSITSYYVFKAYALNLTDFIAAISNSMFVLVVFGIMTLIPLIKRHSKKILIMIIIISFIASLILWLSVDEFTGLSFYFLNITYFFMVSIIHVSESLKDLGKEMALVSFGSFILVSVIVLIIMSEGEALQGLDGFSGSTPSKKKTN